MGRQLNLKKHLELNEIDELIKENKNSYILYQRLLLLRMVYKGETITKASDYVGVTFATGQRWIKNYNEKGLEGLYSNYKNCGRKTYLTDEQLKDLDKKVQENPELRTLKDIQKLIKEEYGIDYKLNSVWQITREKLGFNYGKTFNKYSKSPKDAE